MADEDWQRIEDVCARALALPEADRAAFLDRACVDAPSLRREVASLIVADRKATGFLSRPVSGQLPSEPSIAEFGAGERIGAYRLLSPIGRGGLSTVYAAARADETFDRQVAIKLVRQGWPDDEHVRRFEVERQILAGLEHPNIARLYDGGATEGGLPYLVMELVDGEPIDAHCTRRGLSLDERLSLFRQVCMAVQFAHQNLVVHRDLKPSNILVTREGQPKLVDFGIAKLLNPDLAGARAYPTANWMRVMTPEFASPEQIAGGTITTASDVYSLGAVLYRLLTGQLPRPDARLAATQGMPGEESQRAIVPPSVAVGGSDLAAPDVGSPPGRRQKLLGRPLRGDLDNIVLKALRTESDRRYSSAESFAEDLRRHQAGLPVVARPDTWSYRMRSFARRNRWPVAVGLSGVLVLGIFAVVMSVQVARTSHARDEAEATQAFLVDILAAADPDEGRGESATLREALDRGADRLDLLSDQPLLQANLMHTLGKVYLNLGLFDDAESLLRQSFESRNERLGARDERTLATRNQQGLLLLYQGRYVLAEAEADAALGIGLEALGERHPVVAESLWTLGLVSLAQLDLPAAEGRLRRALHLLVWLHGEQHPTVARSQQALARARMEAGDYREAEALLRRALATMRAHGDELHPALADALGSLGEVLRELGNAGQAEPYLREAVRLKESRLGPDHASTLDALNMLGVALGEFGRAEESAAIHRRVLAARIAAHGEHHPFVAMSLHNLATVEMNRGNLGVAHEIYLRAIDLGRATVGDDHPGLAYILVRFGMLLVMQGAAEACEEPLREAMTIRQRALPADHWLIGDAESALGSCLTLAGRHADAEPLLLHGLARIETTRGHEDIEVKRAKQRLRDLYEAWGRPGAAALYHSAAGP